MVGLLLSCVAIMLASLSGKLLVWRGAGEFIERNLHLMVTFATGVFIVFAWQLAQEVFEHMDILTGAMWIIGGVVAVSLACRFLPHGSHSLKNEHHDHSHLDAHRMLISDSIHNIGDGILLAATFSISPIVGFAATASVFLHEVVQEIAEFFVLRDAGYSTPKAILLNFTTSATILIGAIGSYAVINLFEDMEAPLLAIATGGVLSVVLYDLIPHSYSHAKSEAAIGKHVLWLVLGITLMFAMVSLVPHQDPNHVASVCTICSAKG